MHFQVWLPSVRFWTQQSVDARSGRAKRRFFRRVEKENANHELIETTDHNYNLLWTEETTILEVSGDIDLANSPEMRRVRNLAQVGYLAVAGITSLVGRLRGRGTPKQQ